MRQQGIYDKPDLRLMVEAMLYRMRVGCPWRDLPAEFGSWNSIYQKFNRWSYKDKGVLTIHFLSAYLPRLVRGIQRSCFMRKPIAQS